jgi:uncharacterized protein (DUF1499 family)
MLTARMTGLRVCVCCRAAACLLMLALCGSALCETPLPLPACPDSPNCVSSLSTDSGRYIEPLFYNGPTDTALERLVAVLGAMERMTVRAVHGRHVHAESVSRLFRFVDDVQFYFDQDAGTIHCRSASRTGYWDLGANRRRIETIRKLFAAAQQ